MSRAQVLSASKWVMVSQFGSLAIKMVSVWVMSRLLNPATFGVSTLLFTVLTGFQMLSDIGIRASVLISRRGMEPAFLNTAWSMQVLRGIGVCAAGCASGWPLALWMERPEMAWVMPCLSLTALVDGFVSTRMHVATRQMNFRASTVVPLVGEVVGASVRIGVALIWPSVMAIVLGAIASSSAILLMSHWLLQGHRDRFMLDPLARKEILGMGKWIAASTALVFLGMQVDLLIMAGMIPLSALGVYNLTLMIAAIPTNFLGRLMTSYAQPRLVQVAGDRGRFGSEVDRMRSLMLPPGAAVCSLMMTIGPLAMRLLFDERYADSVWLIQALGFVTWLRIVGQFYSMAVMAIGRAKANALSNLVKAVSLCTLLPLAALNEDDGQRLFVCIVAIVVCEMMKSGVDVANAVRVGIGGAGFDLVTTMRVIVGPMVACVVEVGGVGPHEALGVGIVCVVLVWWSEVARVLGVLRGGKRGRSANARAGA